MRKLVLFALFLLCVVLANASTYKITTLYVVPKHNGVPEKLSEKHKTEVNSKYIIVDAGKIIIGQITYDIRRVDQEPSRDGKTDFLSGLVVDPNNALASFAAAYDDKDKTTSFMFEYNNVIYWFITEKCIDD